MPESHGRRTTEGDENVSSRGPSFGTMDDELDSQRIH